LKHVKLFEDFDLDKFLEQFKRFRLVGKLEPLPESLFVKGITCPQIEIS
jgi:hypothetical protein